MELRKINFWFYSVFLFAIVPSSHGTCSYEYAQQDISGFPDHYYSSALVCTEVKNLTSEVESQGYYGEKIIVKVTKTNLPEIDKNFTPENIKFLYLNMSNLGIKKIADGAFANKTIERLNLRNNDISEIGANAFNSTAIIDLNLRYNYLIRVDFLEGLTSLRSLDLSFSYIRSINTRSFENLTKLEELDLTHSNLYFSRDGVFADLISLKSLKLRRCLLNQFSFTLEGLKSLETVDLSQNSLKTLTDQHLPASLTHLNISHNYISSFSLSNLKNIATLDLSDNLLTKVDEYLKDIHSLKYLYLSKNRITVKDNLFRNMVNLSVIYLDQNSLDKFDFKLFENQSNLTKISLSANILSKVENLESCPTSITKMNFSRNALNEIGPFSKFTELDTLDLSNNMLKKIDYDLFKNCTSLNYLNLDNNNIHVVHLGCFRDLINLRELDMNFNYISNISHGAFTGLKNVKSIKLGYNNLETFDEDIFSSLKNLTSLDLSFNEMKSIDVKKILTHTVSLSSINIDGSEWTCSYLAHLISEFKHVEFVEGHTFNDSNIRGIGCINEDTPEGQSTGTDDFFNQQIASDLHTSAIVLILILILLICYIVFNILKNYIVQILYKMKILKFKTDSWREFQETN